jgi:prophage regulatory protein
MIARPATARRAFFIGVPMMVLLSRSQLKAMGVDYSRPHLWRLVRDGKFPKPVHLGERKIAWVADEIDAHLKRKVAERDANA